MTSAQASGAASESASEGDNETVTGNRRARAAALTGSGRDDEAFVLWHAELSENPAATLAALKSLSRAASHQGQHTLAADYDAMHAMLRWGSRWYPATLPERSLQAQTSILSLAKLRHDIEQFAHLQQLGVLGQEFSAIRDSYRQLAQELVSGRLSRREALTDDEQLRIGAVYNRIVHIRPTPAVAQPFSGSWQAEQVQRSYRRNAPGIVVIDDFLSAEALDGLRRFCLESTVWSSLRYAHGRLGAMYHDGFNCPLLVQLAQTLRAMLPQLIGERHALTQMWAYKYPPRLPGDDVHADFAAVNVNFWLTPDDANLDPDCGGMVIYDVEAPPDWEFERYNRKPELIRSYLRAVGARARYIPYRQNRAVIFNSDLFHGTAACHFRDDYASRRINVTMLYGHRRDDHLHRASAHRAATTPSTSSTSSTSSTPYSAWRSAALRRSRS